MSYRSLACPSPQTIHDHQMTTPMAMRRASHTRGCARRNSLTVVSLPKHGVLARRIPAMTRTAVKPINQNFADCRAALFGGNG